MKMRVNFKEKDSVIQVAFAQKSTTFKADFGEILKVGNAEDCPVYDGNYTVTPAVTEQTLKTAQKKMVADVTIKKIPYFEVSNNSGGTTATIGNEV